MIDDIALFIHVVRHGGLAGAARHLLMPTATVTRRIQKLEQQVGRQLLHRSARRFVLTQEGEVYYQAYADLVDQFEVTRQQLSEDMQQLRGKLRVLAPTNLSHGFLRAMWLGFTRTYPDIQLDLSLSNQVQDIIKSKADIALRIGPQPDSNLYQQKLGAIEKVLVASPDYIAKSGVPLEPAAIRDFRVVGTNLSTKWTLTHEPSGLVQEVFPKFSATFDDTSFVKYMVCDGQGLSLLPLTEVQDELQSGQLVRLLPEWRGEMREIFVVWPSGKLLNAKAKCLREYLREYIRAGLVSAKAAGGSG